MRTLLRLTPGTDAVHCLGIHTDITTKADFRERFIRWSPNRDRPCVIEDYDEGPLEDFLWLEVKDVEEAYRIQDEVDDWTDEEVELFEKRFVTFDKIPE